jgi:lipopolysaccharide transport system ATP-binding protein
MSEAIITVEHLSKRFVITHEERVSYSSLRDVLSGNVKKLFKRKEKITSSVQEDFWALNDLNFEIKRGDRVGIIGRNGAGKSTLLKILSRITEPTRGRITINGRVASLLEVGTGFHPELTGRENVFLNGAILGMSRAEIRSKFDEIVAFAEVEKFLDTPVKRYSSGMYVRLAFAVAAHMEPEILIVDEVLAVGDAQFQKKCLGKMQDVSKNEGRTVLFVSHNIAAINKLCTVGILMGKGQLLFQGPIKDTLNEYKASIGGANEKELSFEDGPKVGDDNFFVKKITVNSLNSDLIDIESGFFIEIVFFNGYQNKTLGLSAILFNDEEINMFEAFSLFADNNSSEVGIYSVKFSIPGYLLNSGNYSIGIIYAESQKYVLFEARDILGFYIENKIVKAGYNLNRLGGVLRPNYKVEVGFIQ